MNGLGLFLVERSLGFNLIRTIFVCLDYVAFTVFGWATQAIFDIANAKLIGAQEFTNFSNRIYVFIGIFMLFKITITLLGYLVSPEKINDKTEGLSKIIGRTLVSITMLVGLPFLWNLLFEKEFTNNKTLNDIILEAVPRVLIGKTSSITGAKDGASSVANTIVWSTYSIVYRHNDADKTEVTEFNTMEAAVEMVNEPGDDNSIYKYDYTLFIGFIIGIVMSIVMISIAIDVAIRAFKLIILRMIAPIPILGYILPQSQKNGGIFSNWVKTFLLTWLDLFIKIGVVFLALYFIDAIVLENGNPDFNGINDFRLATLKVFIVIGLLFFAKQAPKFITDLLGIKNKEVGLGFAKALTAGVVGAGAIGSGVASARAAYAANKVNGHNKGLGIAKAIGAGALGVGSGVLTGTNAALGAKDHATRAAFNAMNERNKKALANGYAGNSLGQKIKNAMGETFAGTPVLNPIEKAKITARNNKQLYDYIMDKGSKAGSGKAVTASYGGSNFTTSYNAFNSAYQHALQNGISKFTVEGKDAFGKTIVQDFKTYDNATGKFEGDLKEASATRWAKDNAAIDETLQIYEGETGFKNGSGYSASDVKGAYKDAETRVFAAESQTGRHGPGGKK